MEGIKGERGYTLIEVVVTMGIFTLVMLVSVNILLSAYKIQERSQHITTVHNEAAKKIEREVDGVNGSIQVKFIDPVSGTIILNETINGSFYTGGATDDIYRSFKPDGLIY